MRRLLLSAVAVVLTTGAAHAASYTYDFKTEANATGKIGEAIFDTFNTSTNGVFVGPNLEVTATRKNDDDEDVDAFVYFDNGNAGMGVCGVEKTSNYTATRKLNSYNPGSGTNLCDPGSDDGLTTTGEQLHFEAKGGGLKITSFFINSNHDAGDVKDTAWSVNGTIYSGADLIPASGGDVRIDVNILLADGDKLTFFGTSGPNSYISAIGVSSVPVPAAGLMLLAGLGGLGAMRARRKA